MTRDCGLNPLRSCDVGCEETREPEMSLAWLRGAKRGRPRRNRKLMNSDSNRWLLIPLSRSVEKRSFCPCETMTEAGVFAYSVRHSLCITRGWGVDPGCLRRNRKETSVDMRFDNCDDYHFTTYTSESSRTLCYGAMWPSKTILRLYIYKYHSSFDQIPPCCCCDNTVGITFGTLAKY